MNLLSIEKPPFFLQLGCQALLKYVSLLIILPVVLNQAGGRRGGVVLIQCAAYNMQQQ
jgi:hypothetical protein